MASRRGTVGKLLVALLLVAFPLALGVYRASDAAYEVERMAPNPSYRVHMGLFFETRSDTLRVRAYLPQNEGHLSLGARWTDTDLTSSAEIYQGGNRRLEWWGETEGRVKVETSFTVIPSAVTYEIDPDFRVPGPPADTTLPFLQATETIQVGDPRIAALAQRLAPRNASTAVALRRLYSYCAELPEPARGKQPPPEDALSTLRGQSGTPRGKSRLFAALARERGLPTRLVQGLVLDPGRGLDATTWAEVRLAASWVPFCPSEGLFARTEGRLVPFCRGDRALVESHPRAKMRTRFEVERSFAVRGRLIEGSGKSASSWLGVWGALEESGVSVNILVIVLMLPVGAFLTVFLRNIFGLRTFGFFLPMLIAVAAMRAGLIWAITGLLFVIGAVFLFRLMTESLRLLHFPRLAAALTSTVLAILGLAALGALSGNLNLAHVTYLPVVVLTIATEQFSRVIDEEGPIEVLKVTGMTVAAIAVCYLLMSNYALQKFVLTFPEIFLVLIFFNILVGCWTGMRLSEYLRFRQLIEAERAVGHA
ncbi:MAG: hypothetical protein GF330_05295 [Candidatus Eisenbacteria bacterium]|nr:hypothetical protein [Candidatus Eisenbacteria bacterium]